MSKPESGRLLAWIERCSWILGLTLVVFYGGARAWSEHVRQHGIALAREAPFQIDRSDWSKQRIIAFDESARGAGAPEGVLRIPSVQLEVPIYAGTSEINLNRGAAHIEGTSGLTQGGNIGIAGHRDGFFRKLKDVRVNSEIDLEVDGQTLRYQVTEIRVVAPTERDVLDPTAAPSVTLITCYPFYFIGNAPERYVVRAELAGA